MEKWNAFLKDYNCLYANDQQNGLRSKIKLFLRILFSPNTQVLRDIKPHSMLYDPFAVSKRKWFVKYGYQGFYCE